MADFITPFDPTAAASGSFPLTLVNGGWLFIHNESACEMAFTVGIMTAPVLVPAFTARCFQVPLASRVAKWSRIAQLTNGTPPVSQIYAEAYQPNEWTGGEMYVALGRMGTPQPRVIALPPGIQNWHTSQGAVGNWTASETDIGTIGLSAANKAAGNIGVYVNALYAQVGLATIGNYEIDITLRLRKADLTVLNNIRICYWFNIITANEPNGEEMRREFPAPLCWNPTGDFSQADHVAMVAHLYSGLGAGTGFYSFLASWWLDLVNADVIASPGNQAWHNNPTNLF